MVCGWRWWGLGQFHLVHPARLICFNDIQWWGLLSNIGSHTLHIVLLRIYHIVSGDTLDTDKSSGNHCPKNTNPKMMFCLGGSLLSWSYISWTGITWSVLPPQAFIDTSSLWSHPLLTPTLSYLPHKSNVAHISYNPHSKVSPQSVATLPVFL